MQEAVIKSFNDKVPKVVVAAVDVVTTALRLVTHSGLVWCRHILSSEPRYMLTCYVRAASLVSKSYRLSLF